MKKKIILLSLVLGLLFSVNNFAYSFDLEKVRTVSEIGTLVNAKDYQTALAKCNAALEKYPEDSDLYYWRASIYSFEGKYEQALTDYNKVISLTPKDADALVMRGICKSSLGDFEGAIADFNSALAIDPKNSSAYSMRACVRMEMGELESANEDLKKANVLFDEEEKKIQETPTVENQD